MEVDECVGADVPRVADTTMRVWRIQLKARR